MTELNKIYLGDVLEVLKSWPDEFVDCIVTSPPYYGLRDYGTAKWEGGDEKCDHEIPENEKDPKNPNAGSHISRFNKENCYKCGAKRIDQQIGLEKTLEEYLEKMLAITKELKRVLKPTGTLWWNHGDSYGANWRGGTKETATKMGVSNRGITDFMGRDGKTEKCMLMQNYRLAIRMIDDDGDDIYELRKDAPDWVLQELKKKGIM